MKHLLMSLMLASLMMAVPEMSKAQQDTNAGTDQTQSQKDSKKSIDDKADRKPVSNQRIRCSTPTCFAKHPGGYYDGPAHHN